MCNDNEVIRTFLRIRQNTLTWCSDNALKNQNNALSIQIQEGEKNMGKYIVKRVILAIFTIFIISLITFFAMNAIPGGPFNSEKAKSPAVMKELEARYGLDQPLICLLYTSHAAKKHRIHQQSLQQRHRLQRRSRCLRKRKP